nr:forkhead transcription factor DAF-16 [Haemonchus contortus]
MSAYRCTFTVPPMFESLGAHMIQLGNFGGSRRLRNINNTLPAHISTSTVPIPRQGAMANQLSQTQCLTQAATLTPLSTFGPPLTGAFHQSLQSPTMAAACYYGSSQSLMPNQTAHMNYPSLNTTSPSTDSLFSVSTSLNSLPSECPPRRSDLDLKMETPDG